MAFSYKTVWRLAGPNITSNVLMVAISFAHLAIVAPFGREASAAVVTGGRVHFLLMAASMALSVATTAVVARAWGADDGDEASAAATSSLVLSVLISLGLGFITFLFAPQIVHLFNLDPKTEALAVGYIRPASLLNIVFSLMLTIATSFRAIGDVIRPLRFIACGAALSILGSYICVHGAFGVPEMGVTGIPWGTAGGQSLVVLWFAVCWLKRRYVLAPKLDDALNTRRLRLLASIGTPAALEQILIQVSFLLFMMLISAYGTAAFAAYGIGITVLSVTIVVGLGFGTASATLAGQRLGAKDAAGAVASGWAAMRLAILGMSLLAILTFIFRDPIATVLSSDPAVREHTEFFVLILAIVQPLMAVEFAIGGALRGAGDTKFPLVVTFAGMIVGRLTIGLIVRALGGPVEAMYAVIIADYTIKAALLILRFRKINWHELEDHPHAPIAIQSVAGISRVAVRSFFSRRNGGDNAQGK
ncbi:MATE family efflux transporter [Kordiimonas gwangyangensis]|uniref:MATE family efflux transporter n=1 Tax=Kordiimonas gwangyangensis TaxID=288022 RepID=UPI000361F672|nr:MATE family efflux transporter [Kordiimonas gwangyangensis]